MSPIRGMARPRRPRAEHIAVGEALNQIRGKAPNCPDIEAAQSIASAVTEDLFAELQRTDDDELDLMLGELIESVRGSIWRLATSPEINTHADFMKIRIAIVESRAGRWLGDDQRATEKSELRKRLILRLSRRYLRIIRKLRFGDPTH